MIKTKNKGIRKFATCLRTQPTLVASMCKPGRVKISNPRCAKRCPLSWLVLGLRTRFGLKETRKPKCAKIAKHLQRACSPGATWRDLPINAQVGKARPIKLRDNLQWRNVHGTLGVTTLSKKTRVLHGNASIDTTCPYQRHFGALLKHKVKGYVFEGVDFAFAFAFLPFPFSMYLRRL